MFKNILLATDGSAASERAARLAVELAGEQGATLTAVYVVDPYPYLGIGDINPMGLHAYLAADRNHAAEAHAHVETLCEEAQPPVRLELRLVEDASAVVGILETAKKEHADLIVTGSHGRSGLARVSLGNVAAKIVAQSHVPVLVAR